MIPLRVFRARSAGLPDLTDAGDRRPWRERHELLLEEMIARHGDHDVAVIAIGLGELSAATGTVERGDRRLAIAAATARLGAALGGDAAVEQLSSGRLVVFAAAAERHAARRVATSALRSLTMPVPVAGREVRFLEVAGGVAMYPADGTNLGALYRKAETAMHHARASGGRVTVFDADAALVGLERFELEQSLALALGRKEFVLRFQPLVDAVTGHIRSVEALVRWVRGDGEEIPPAQFLGTAEESGLIVDIDRWVVAEACAQLARWDADDIPVPRISVNVSSRTLEAGSMDRDVAAALAGAGLHGERLELEVTETGLLKDPAETAALLARLRGLGVRLAIDDFGTGYSSFAYLKSYRFDTLKIDRSFIVDLTAEEVGLCTADRMIVRSIVGLAGDLGLDVVAEGVETAAQRDVLIDLGCAELQGYLFGRPMTAAALELLTPTAVDTR